MVRVDAAQLGEAAAGAAAEALAESEGTVGVIAPLGVHGALRGLRAAEAAKATADGASDRLWVGTPDDAKGLEFDLVVLLDPETFGGGIEGAVDRYVAMTRATQQLVVLKSP